MVAMVAIDDMTRIASPHCLKTHPSGLSVRNVRNAPC
jgi:hypothetical protein